MPKTTNGQKGKTREEIAQVAHDKAMAKATATEIRLGAAKAAGATRAIKKREKAKNALEKAVAQCANAGLEIVNDDGDIIQGITAVAWD